MPHPPVPAEPRRIGPYRVAASLGSGGMGTVHLAVVEGVVEGATVGEHVALKLLHSHLVADEEAFDRFVQEASLGKLIRNENVVRTIDAGMDFGDDADRAYLAMEYVTGRTLASIRTEAGKLDERTCRRIAREVARGLRAIHACGVVHGDLKPENVFVTDDDVVKVMDLGLARLRSGRRAPRTPGSRSTGGHGKTGGAGSSNTGASRFEGTLLYAAPEQFSEGERALDGRADLYALGVTLHECLAGVHPFAHDDVRVVMHRHLHEPAPHVRDAAPHVSPFLDAVIARLLEKDPSHRFRSAAELVHTLERAEESPWWRRRSAGSTAAPGADTADADAAARDDHSTARIVGREEELATLLAACDATAGPAAQPLVGSAGAVLLLGEPGIGRSRVLREFAALLEQRADGRAIVWTSPSSAASRIDGVAGPAAVLLDDAERATPAESAEIRAALRRASRRPVLFVAACPETGACPIREALSDDPAVVPLPLARLGPAAVRALIDESMDSGSVDDETAHWVSRWSDGVPHAALLLVRGLVAADAIACDADGVWRPRTELRLQPLPVECASWVAARLAALTPEETETVDLLACAGPEFSLGTVSTAFGEDRGAVSVRLGALVRRGVLRSIDGERFAFALRAICRAAADQVQEMLRPEYHRMLADAEAASPAGEDAGARSASIARHLTAAGDLAGAESHVVAGARHLAATGRWDETLDLIGPFLDAGGPAHPALASLAAEAYLAKGRIDDARAVLAKVGSSLGRPATATRPASSRADPSRATGSPGLGRSTA